MKEIMNLQELLNYHQKCVICQNELELACDFDKLYYMNLQPSLTNDGLKIKSEGSGRTIDYLFKLDGTFQYNNFYKKPFIINKKCKSCMHDFLKNENYANIKKIKTLNYLKSGTTINNIKSQGTFYSFAIYTNTLGTYEADILSDNIRYYNANEFWHLNTDFKKTDQDSATNLYHGKFNQSLTEIFKLSIPTVNVSNIKTKEQLINKFKLYTLFS